LKPVVIVNPRSGAGRTGKAFAEMRGPITRAIGEFEALQTECKGHAIELARAVALEGRPLVVAVGGDGTFHEVVNGVMESEKKDTRVGFIMQGTGGDFRKTIGIEHRLDKYLEALASGGERPLDVGKLTYTTKDGNTRTRFFVNIYSAGMGGLVDRYVAEGGNLLGGKASYFMASAKALVRAARGRVRCRSSSEGEVEARTLATYMIAVCNGRYFGGGMHVAPMAKPDDGRLEVIAMDAPSKLGFTLYSQKIYDGRHVREPGTTHFSCEAIDLALENPDVADVFLNDVDGEPLGGLPARAEIVRHALVLRA
jgi:YegS/Rv2252/BmrU family lipid kinase